MGKRLFVLLTIALVTSLMVTSLMACAPVQEGTEELEDVALKFLEKVDVQPSSHVYLVGPVKPGTVIREEAAPNVTAVELKVAERPGTHYVFFVDDMPYCKSAHLMRYAWMEYECGNTKVVNASGWPVILEPGVEPTPFTITRSVTIDGISFKGLVGGGTGVINDIPHKVLTPLPDIQVSGNQCENRRFALVIDGGDKDRLFDLADNFAEDADNIAGWLEEKGYQVHRISQYWGNDHPFCTRQRLVDIVVAYAGKLKCCDNFFLYIGSHGLNSFSTAEPQSASVEIYDPTGNGDKSEVRYSNLFNWLNAFPNCAKVTIFIDACFSGNAIPALKRLEDKLSKVVIITATDANKRAAGGQGLTDSATQDFMQGANKDIDGDGKVGDLGDRVLEMRNQGTGYNPQIYPEPNPAGDNLGDLD